MIIVRHLELNLPVTKHVTKPLELLICYIINVSPIKSDTLQAKFKLHYTNTQPLFWRMQVIIACSLLHRDSCTNIVSTSKLLKEERLLPRRNLSLQRIFISIPRKSIGGSPSS